MATFGSPSIFMSAARRAAPPDGSDKSPPDIVIRAATAGDFIAVRALLIVAHAEHQLKIPPSRFSRHLTELLDLESRFGHSHLLVARRRGVNGDRLVGTATYFPDGEQQLPAWPSKWASVSGLAVAPQARGLGVATLLMQTCLDRAQREGSPVMAVHAGDFMKPAVRLAWRLGFRRAPAYDYQIASDLSDGPAPASTAFAYLRVLD